MLAATAVATAALPRATRTVQGGPKNLAPFFSVRLNFTKY